MAGELHGESVAIRTDAPARAGLVAQPTLCAAICTRGRPRQLRRALLSLQAQLPPPAEILVVENAPQDETTRALVAREFPCVRYVVEPVPGLDFARNRALRSASAEAVAFLDDDAVAEAGWVAALQAAFAEQPRVGAITGRIEPLAVETEAQRLFEANGGLFAAGERRVRLPRDASGPLSRLAPPVAWAVGLGSGCNLAVRRSAALQLGGFDEALDLGADLPGGGDQDILWRMLDAGWEVAYEPAARVRHEHRREEREVHDQILGHQRAMVALVAKAARQARGAARFSTAAFLAWRLLKPGVRLLRRAVGRDPLPAGLLLRIWWHCWRGVAAYPRMQAEAARRRAVR